MDARYVIFDLDDTLVRSDAVREAFGVVGHAYGIERTRLTRSLDNLPGRPAREIFDALGLDDKDAITATERFLTVLDELNAQAPPVAYPDADTTLRELAASGAQLMLSTGSSPERARRVLDREGWDTFTVVLGSDAGCSKGAAHYDRMAAEAPHDTQWTQSAVTVGDSPRDMRLGAEHGVPVRIGINRDGDPRPLFAAGATHVVSALAEVVSIVASIQVRSNVDVSVRTTGRTRLARETGRRMSVHSRPRVIAFSRCWCYETATWREHGCTRW